MSARHRIWSGSATDVADLARIHAPLFADPWPQDAFASLLSRPEVFALLGARREGSPAEGFIVVRAVADEAEILTLGVVTQARRAGLGKALLTAGCKEARRRGARHAFLEVGENNASALSLYRSAGFAPVGRRAAYYRHGPEAADAIVMRKDFAEKVASLTGD